MPFPRISQKHLEFSLVPSGTSHNGIGVEMQIQPETFYTPQDDVMRVIAAVQTLAKWRHENRGPAYIKSGKRIIYRGSDILEWMDKNRTEPAAA